MSGIFDHMNRPNVGENEQTLNPAFMCGVAMRRLLGLSNNAELLALINTELDASGPLGAEAQQDLVDIIVTWIDGATGVENKAARLGLMCDIWGIYEQARPDGTPWLSETEARTAFGAAGVTFTFSV